MGQLNYLINASVAAQHSPSPILNVGLPHYSVKIENIGKALLPDEAFKTVSTRINTTGDWW